MLILSLTVHEAAHAWAANRLGDPTARLLGRLSLNPLVHIDPVGTVVFPLVAITTGLPLIGWAKPVPVDFRNLRTPRRDFALDCRRGAGQQLLMALVGAGLFAAVRRGVGELRWLLELAYSFREHERSAGGVQHAADSAARRRQRPHGRAAARPRPAVVERMRPYGFFVLYALDAHRACCSGWCARCSRFILGWLL